jgi:hypothetical protein
MPDRNFGLGPIATAAGRALARLDIALDALGCARVQSPAGRSLRIRRDRVARSPWMLLDQTVLDGLVETLWLTHESLPREDWLFADGAVADALSDAYHALLDIDRAVRGIIDAARVLEAA